MSLVRGDLHIGDGLDPFEQSGGLPHGRDQMRPYVGTSILIFKGIQKSIKICHADGHVGTWCLKHLLISNHVKSIVKVVWG